MPRRIPKPVEELWKHYPTVWKAFNELGSRCHEAGPLDEKSRRLVKLALSLGAGLEGATRSAVRNASDVGITQEEIDHVALLAVSTLGMPAATPLSPGSETRAGASRTGSRSYRLRSERIPAADRRATQPGVGVRPQLTGAGRVALRSKPIPR
jgi:4-carboxymuconolactone decarboxylase